MFVSLPGLSEAPAWIHKRASTWRTERILRRDPKSRRLHRSTSSMLTFLACTLAGGAVGIVVFFALWYAGYGNSVWTMILASVCIYIGMLTTLPVTKWLDKRGDVLNLRRTELVKRLYQERKLHPVHIDTPLGILANYVAMYQMLGRYNEGMLYEGGGGHDDPEAIKLLTANETAVEDFLADQDLWTSWRLYVQHDRKRLKEAAFMYDDSDPFSILTLSNEALDSYTAELHLRHGKGMYERSDFLHDVAQKADTVAKRLVGIPAEVAQAS